MHFKRLLLKACAFLIVGLAAVASAAVIAYKSPASLQQERLLPVNATQLPLENGAFPVELRCEEARSPAPNKLNEFSCLVINNTRKKISALAIIYTVIVDSGGGGEEQETNLLTSDFAIHPDISEIKRQTLFSPRESRRVGPPGPVTFESGTVSGVNIRIDYVEFEDKTSIGPNTQGSKMIGSMREGAAKYKAWLVQQYKQGGMDEQATAALLDATDLPKELNFDGNPDLSEGARFYRRVVRSVYTSKGAAGLRHYLNK
jgi:hypothetical protein